MESLNYKKNLRRLNKIIRSANDSILKDSLWKGRFYVAQKQVIATTYDDKSGMHFFMLLEFVDLATGIVARNWYDICDPRFFSSDVFLGLNNFIVQGVNAWSIEPDPYVDTKVYRKTNELPKYDSSNWVWMNQNGLLYDR
jgi:hypothetical protein